ncbi:MAG: hypothetical protein F4Y02_13210 [Chloroflexi bacterium]|nr:hypothetical protein [Chloroflexota bacterium]
MGRPESSPDGVVDGATVAGAKRSVFHGQSDIVALTIVDAGHSVVSVARQVQINQNALGVQFSDSDMEKVEPGVCEMRTGGGVRVWRGDGSGRESRSEGAW